MCIMSKKVKKLNKRVRKSANKKVGISDFRKALGYSARERVKQISDDDLLNMSYTDLSLNIARLAVVYLNLTEMRGIRERGNCMNEEEFHRGEPTHRRWAESFARHAKDKSVRAIIHSANCAQNCAE